MSLCSAWLFPVRVETISAAILARTKAYGRYKNGYWPGNCRGAVTLMSRVRFTVRVVLKEITVS